MGGGMRLRIVLSAFVLPLFMLVSIIGPEGTLLCFGKDGHVALEYVDTCNTAGSGSELAGNKSDDCGPCKDVQFISTPLCTRNVSHSQTLSLSFLPLMSPAVSAQEDAVKHTDNPAYSHHKKILTSLQSVVLLI